LHDGMRGGMGAFASFRGKTNRGKPGQKNNDG
jgi:hypothetical protein